MKVRTNGIETHYTLEGAAGAPVVTLSHSLATDLSMWEPQMAALRARYRVLSYDTRGHGGTDVPATAYTLDQLLSMGGMIGQTLALKHPEVFASLSLCDTSSRIPAEAKPLWADRIKTAETQGMEPLVEPTLARWLTAPFRERRKDVADKVAAMIRSTPPKGYAGCCHAIAALDLTERISAISLPTFVIVGEEDQGTPVAASKVMHERIKGSQLVILPSAAHLSNLEQPQAFTDALIGFLDKNSAS